MGITMMINENNWYFIVRNGTNERLINNSGNINVCKWHHIPRILDVLNRYSNTWHAMTIAEYKLVFGEYALSAKMYEEYAE